MRVLLVEDSHRLRETLASALRRSGYAVDLAADGEEALSLATSNAYDAIVLDIMLPKVDGLEVLQRLRRQGNATHVLLLTARDAVQDRVDGLQKGADDYLVKPFSLEELLARVQALCRRVYNQKEPSLKIGDLEVDTVGRRVLRAGQPIELTMREYLLIEYLAHRPGQIVSRAEIEAHIYDDQIDPMSNVVDSAICSLRKKIGTANPAPLIHTRRGLGYVLEAASPLVATL